MPVPRIDTIPVLGVPEPEFIWIAVTNQGVEVIPPRAVAFAWNAVMSFKIEEGHEHTSPIDGIAIYLNGESEPVRTLGFEPINLSPACALRISYHARANLKLLPLPVSALKDIS